MARASLNSNVLSLVRQTREHAKCRESNAALPYSSLLHTFLCRYHREGQSEALQHAMTGIMKIIFEEHRQ